MSPFKMWNVFDFLNLNFLLAHVNALPSNENLEADQVIGMVRFLQRVLGSDMREIFVQ